ncbi:MAG: DUF3109 family protein [Prevotellaceae bacterium]|jgi:hypothetical protein|nr:DUF3109 family protein [Prevotellaceae bacterium]
MLKIDNTIISFDLFDKYFACDLHTCKGQCCVDGDEGAPLADEEVEILEKIAPAVLEFLPEKSRQIIESQGVCYIDHDGESVTMLVEGNECAFVYRDENGCAKCAIEKAYKAGKIDFYKPISCHLYPVRLQKYNDFVAVNYHQWSVCECAFKLGKAKKIAVYQFLKEPLIRRFGEKWYAELEIAAKENMTQN